MYILVFITSLFFTFLVAFSGSGYFSFFVFGFKFIFAALIFSALTVYGIKLSNRYNKSSRLSILLILIPPTIVLIISLIDYKRTLISLPSNLAYILGICFGVVFYRIKSIKWRVVLSSFYSISLLIMGIYFYPKWNHLSNFGSFSGRTNKEYKLIDFNGVNEDKIKVDNSIFNGKVVVFNFWNTGCRYCKIDFPYYKELSKKYTSNDTIFVAYNYPLKRDKLESTLNYFDFTNSEVTIIVPNDKHLFEKLNINSFPSYLVVNESSEIVFLGGLDMLKEFLSSN